MLHKGGFGMMGKKVLSLLLAVTMLIATLPMGVFANERSKLRTSVLGELKAQQTTQKKLLKAGF